MMSQTHLHNVETGETIVRDLTDAETAQFEHDIAVTRAQEAAETAAVAARQSAIDKLAALGLTVDEISAAFGLGGS